MKQSKCPSGTVFCVHKRLRWVVSLSLDTMGHKNPRSPVKIVCGGLHYVLGLYEHALNLELAVYLVREAAIQVGLHQYIPETADGRAVRHFVIHGQAGKPAERNAVVNLTSHPTATQSVPHAEQFYAEQDEAVIAGTARPTFPFV